MKKYVVRRNRHSIFTNKEISILEDLSREQAFCAGMGSALILVEDMMGDAHDVSVKLREAYMRELYNKDVYESLITDEIKNKIEYNGTEYVKRMARNRKIRNRNVI